LTPADIRAARARLGLSANGLAAALRLGTHGGRTVRRWEAGQCPIQGPAQVAIGLMLKAQGLVVPRALAPRQGALDAPAPPQSEADHPAG
jgi:DNA-binding transcriptional regulator YiaG